MKYFRAASFKRPVDIEYRDATICWHCTKSVGSRCSWSANFVPVEGWEAKETWIHTSGNDYIQSYQVISCPQFTRG